MIIDVTGELWLWESRTDTWTFLTVPGEHGEVVRELHGSLPRRGFGAVRVEVEAGTTRWRTSIFPGADGAYVLPIKRAVRDAQDWQVGERVSVTVRLLDL